MSHRHTETMSDSVDAIVRGFVNANEEVVAARVVREVRNKLRTGLKNPK